MNTSNIKRYAPKARKDFIAAITKQAEKYGISKKTIAPMEIKGDLAIIADRPFPATIAKARDALVKKVEQLGFIQTIEQVAYCWFNRLCAIRYMELHDYLGHGRRVLSHDAQGSANVAGGRKPGATRPTGYQLLEDCLDVEFPGLDQNYVRELKLDGTKDEELYRELLLAQCHALHQAMPFLFETIDDETELLLPENLTKTDSLIHDLITDIPEDDWSNVEIIGWLYQFYISEKKDEVIGKVVKSEDIPAATQLFTPNWIVKYMVQNSLGAQWLATYPESPLKEQMEYYITPAEQTDEVNAQLKAITPESLNPEELTLIDPASGSGHILVEAYDLFKAIYLERGYRQRDIAQLILEKNLFGLDIDQRAAQLTGFALMMKGREDDRRLFERSVKLNVMAMVDSASLDVDTLVHGINLSQHGLHAEDLTALKDLFEHATTFGSLIQVPQILAEKLPALKQLSETNSQDMFVAEVLEHLAPLVKQAEILVAQYDAVVANPPYMGGKGMNSVVKNFVKNNFPDAKSDLFACFIERGYTLAKTTGHNAMVTMQSWMFLSSFEAMRINMLTEKTINSMAHLGARAFGSISGEVVQTTACVLKNFHIEGYKPTFFRLLAGNENQKRIALIKGEERFDKSAQDEFKKIPGSPIAYWITEAVRQVFVDSDLLTSFADIGKGLDTGDNERFLRRWFEVSQSPRWVPCLKGGTYRKWFGNHDYVIDWGEDGRDLRSFSGSNLRNAHNYMRSGISWTRISGTPAFRFFPKGFIFESTGPCIFTESLDQAQLSAFLNSNIVPEFLKFIAPTLDFQSGHVSLLPILRDFSIGVDAGIRANIIISLAQSDWDTYERSWDFQFFPVLMVSPELTIESSYIAWVSKNHESIAEMQLLEEENNRLFIDAYGLQDELSPQVPIEQITLTVNPAYRYGIKGTEEERNTRFREDTMAELVSYAIGCMMGRYSLDEPGLIYANSGNVGFDLLVEKGAYTKFPADDDGIIPLTDKEWFADDADNRLVEFISVAWPFEHLEENLAFLAANLSPKNNEDSRATIRRYLCDKFYKDHMQTYKKRPIYWLFSSGKQKAFQCLVYLHRYNEGTLARMRTEYVIPLTAKLTTHVSKLEKDVEASSSTAEIKKLEKEIAHLHKQQTELSAFDEKLRHYADQRISLDLDDGVKVNYGKFGDLLAEVKAIHGETPEII
ncbi:MAG: BREX-1 system adenine-specific DNA-methyltransferase PglX [Pseudomonadales bacterium]|nr:BREX-1 system adenine-specific DNA-methyltransferase PglX [Pseudomonadales bacterium]